MITQKSLAEPKNGRVALSTAIPFDKWQEAVANNWKWNDLIMCGIEHKKGFQKVLDRIHELEEDSLKAQEKIRKIGLKNNELTVEIMRMQKGKNDVQ